MDEFRVDRMARHLAQGPLSRRAALRAGGLGVVAALRQRVGLAAPGAAAGDDPGGAGEAPAAQGTPAPPRRRARSRSMGRGCAASRTRCAPRRHANDPPATPRWRPAPASCWTATRLASPPAGSERWPARRWSRPFPPKTSPVPSASSPARRRFPGPTAWTCRASSIPSTQRWRPASVRWWRAGPRSPSAAAATPARARR
jgi:hypothetical protein